MGNISLSRKRAYKSPRSPRLARPESISTWSGIPSLRAQARNSREESGAHPTCQRFAMSAPYPREFR